MQTVLKEPVPTAAQPLAAAGWLKSGTPMATNIPTMEIAIIREDIRFQFEGSLYNPLSWTDPAG
jgi:hypothetical protein